LYLRPKQTSYDFVSYSYEFCTLIFKASQICRSHNHNHHALSLGLVALTAARPWCASTFAKSQVNGKLTDFAAISLPKIAGNETSTYYGTI